MSGVSPSSTAPHSSGLPPRKGALISLVAGVIILLLVALSQNAFNLTFFRPTTSQQTLVLVALSAVVFLLLIGLSFVLLRNLLKLYAERRVGKLGSQFRTRMVTGALALSFVPVIFLFAFAYLLMNRSIDKWFSHPVDELRADSDRVASLLTDYARENSSSEAREMASLPEAQQAFHTGNFSGLMDEFRHHEKTLQGGFVLALMNDDLAAGFDAPQAWRELRSNVPALRQLRRSPEALFTLNGRDYSLGSARVGDAGQIVVAIPLPPNLRATLSHIDTTQRNYYELGQQRKQIRTMFLLFLLLITTLVLFFATWMALFVSKLVTRPVEALAEATQEISHGRYDYRIGISAADELGALVASFNQMAAELEAARSSMEDSSRQIAGANSELEQRRRQMETVLESIPTGVLSLDAGQHIARANQALTRIFSPQGAANGKVAIFPSGASLRDVFPAELAADLESMMRKADRMGSVTSQMEVHAAGGRLTVAVTVASLHHAQPRMGWVIVFDDLSDLLKANKQAAWQEVARRVAHEIKNPLTPIALSAERIQRHIERGDGQPDPASLQVIRDCSQTIGSAVETVRSLVDEFSAMARFPASQPRPADLNTIVRDAIALFNGRLDGIQLRTTLAEGLPPVLADPAAMQRALANIVDNAAEALQQSLVKDVLISTALLQARDAVELVIADSGPGVGQEAKEKLFLPYFSTKRRGTGLGLAIVGRIVEEHRGSVRIEENAPIGTRFVIELPVAAADAQSATTH